MRLRAEIAPPGVPGATPNQPSPPRSRPELGRSVVVRMPAHQPRPDQREADERRHGDEQRPAGVAIAQRDATRDTPTPPRGA